MRRIIMITPLIITLAVLLLLLVKLVQQPKPFESPLIGKPLPEFSLPPMIDKKGLSNADFKGHYALINVFASWCITCEIEHPILMGLKQDGRVKVYGIAWKDTPEKITEFLKERGNPYERIGNDANGQVILKLGVTGAPESFLVSPEGIVLYRYAGNLTDEIVKNEIMTRVK